MFEGQRFAILAMFKSFDIYIVLNLCNIVYFMTGCTIFNLRLGSALKSGEEEDKLGPGTADQY